MNRIVRIVLVTTVVVTVAARSARAEAAKVADRIELKYVTPRVVSLEPPCELGPVRWELHCPATLDRLPLPCSVLELRGPIHFKMKKPGPNGLDLQVRQDRFLFSVGADMGDGRYPIATRIDCATAQCYFWLRTSFDLSDHLTVFAESFQGANSILGSSRPPPSFVWDGFQLHAGAQLRLTDALVLEGGPVFYALSGTQKPGGLGGRIGLRFEF